ncbi:MAG TPA: class I SAM-dependent methyltransferase [Candidatus Korarchaeota archaeon]|nr:class I SAM-dependent methyltransferase [Candidatus Korarchaeota archaeon]
MLRIPHPWWTSLKDVIFKHLSGSSSLLDLGCGSGRVLERIIEADIPKVYGIDIDVERLMEARVRCPPANLVASELRYLPFRDETFDAVLISMVLHEVESFGGGLDAVKGALMEAGRVLVYGGKAVIIDHLSPGSEMVTAKLTSEMMEKLRLFTDRFIHHKPRWIGLGDGKVKISKRDLQEFATKIRSLDSSLEMVETHAPFTREELLKMLMECHLTPTLMIEFQSIEDKLSEAGIKLLDSKPWMRKILCMAEKGCLNPMPQNEKLKPKDRFKMLV